MQFAKLKATYILLFVLLGLGVYVFWYDNPDRIADAERKNFQVSLFDGFDGSQMREIQIIKKDQTVRLVNENDKWFVVLSDRERYPIVETYLSSAFEGLKNMKTGDVISQNKENYANFDLDEEHQVRAVFFKKGSSGPSYELIIGKSGPVYPSQYVKLDGKDDVVLVRQAVKTLLDRGFSGWRDKTVLKLDKANVASYSFSYAINKKKMAFTVARKDNQWEITAPAKVLADAYLADRLFNTVSNLIATDFGTMEDSGNLSGLGLIDGKETLKIVVTMNDESAHTLWVDNKSGESGYYAKVSDNDSVYIIGNEVEIFTKQDLERLKSKE